ncbi:MAG: hypothetical protein M3328_04345 [Chloroflexota bacterium]|nr:hypothetical protein [Chloroflexota bacterium]
MSATAGVEVSGVRTRDRGRYVWLVLVLSTLAFFALCGLLGTSVFGFLTSITEPQTGILELRKGTQLTVQRIGTTAPVFVADKSVLNEGDRTTTGPDSEGYVDLFQGDITVRTYFSTTITLDTLRTSRFFQNLRQMKLTLDTGTVVVATGSPADYTDEDYRVATVDGDVMVPSQSRVRVIRNPGQPGTTVVVEEGTASVFSQGHRLELGANKMVTAQRGGGFSAVSTAFEELIRNGNFIDPWTGGAESREQGGLGIAAWLPIRENAGGPDARSNRVEVINEMVGSNTNYLVDIRRDGPTDQYGRLGIRQEINRPVDYLERIELRASIRVVQQPDVIGGPSGAVYPLTIKVNYTDAQGNPQSWTRSFYYGQDEGPVDETANVERVAQNRWTLVPAPGDKSERYTLKPNAEQPGLVPDIINSIEIYGYGSQFNSSISSISLLGY